MKDIESLEQQINLGCRFCTTPEKDRILYETKNFYVMVSLGAFVEGYLLIVSKEHFGACLNIPIHLMSEFVELKQKVVDILIQVYGNCICYEHGKVGSSLVLEGGSKHCYHAHLHCVPVSVKLNSIISLELIYSQYESFKDAYIDNNDIEKYIYVEDDVVRVYKGNDGLRKQYLRYKLSEALGLEDEWDWIKFQNWDMIKKTVERLKPYFL